MLSLRVITLIQTVRNLKISLRITPKASSAEYTISTSRQGEFKKEMSISYSDYEAGDGKLKKCLLVI